MGESPAPINSDPDKCFVIKIENEDEVEKIGEIEEIEIDNGKVDEIENEKVELVNGKSAIENEVEEIIHVNTPEINQAPEPTITQKVESPPGTSSNFRERRQSNGRLINQQQFLTDIFNRNGQLYYL